MSIFDSIINNITPFEDAAGDLLSSVGVGKPAKASKEDSAYSSLREADLLQRNMMSLPYTQGKEFTASKSKPAEQVDSDAINQQWLQRLNRYTTIATQPGRRS